MNPRDVIEDYYAWLLETIGANLPPHNNHALLLSTLYSREFVWDTWNFSKDAGRAADGIQLRQQYLDIYYGGNSYYLEFWGNKGCSVLEMLIALATRTTFIVTGFEPEDSLSFWFWKMIDNLSLGYFTDDVFESWKVNSIIDAFLNRAYTKHGDGSIFHTRSKNFDCRAVELFYQMQQYVNETYIS